MPSRVSRFPRSLDPRRIGVGACASMLVAVLGAGHATAQVLEPVNGPRHVHPDVHALVNATVVPEPGTQLDDATILIAHGRIVAVGADVAVPQDARVWDLEGHTVYPGLIDAWAEVEAPAPDPTAPGTHWLSTVHGQVRAVDGTGLDGSARDRMRDLGFTVAQIAPSTGNVRGQAGVVTLADDRPSSPAPLIVRMSSAHVLDFDRQSGGYPSSRMGGISVVRQQLMDAVWWTERRAAWDAAPDSVERPEPNDSAIALAAPLPLALVASDELDVLRADSIATEADRPSYVIGTGTEFRRLDAIAEREIVLVVPVTVPDDPSVSTIADQQAVTLRDLVTWEQAPTNLRRLADRDLLVAVTSSRLRRGERFRDRLALAIDHGLSEDDALAMLTTAPASILGIDASHGRITPGRAACLTVVDGSYFDATADIRSVWIDGVRHEVTAPPDADLSGTWTVRSDDDPAFAGTVTLAGDTDLRWQRPADEASEADAADGAGDDAAADDAADDADDAGDETGDDAEADDGPPAYRARGLRRLDDRLDGLIDGRAFGLESERPIAITVTREGDTLFGDALLPGGRLVRWTGSPAESDAEDDTAEDAGDADDAEADDAADDDAGDDADTTIDVPEAFGLPVGAYAVTTEERDRTAGAVLLTGGTIWTCGPQGVIEDGAVLLVDGTIRAVGPASELRAPAGGRTIDLNGAHVTPGLIDCHSHTGISAGINEGGQTVTCEARIADVLNPDAIGWYRQLAGGVTAVNQLHGSANPIGGQNHVVKLRWGVADPDDMALEGARSGVKFALGENVKRSRSRTSTRYPATRMGVEAIIRDRLQAGLEYDRTWDAWRALPAAERTAATRPRRDLELEAMAEIATGERLIHCHSYRQDEILMLARVAQDYGFTIGTYQHVLEGYKVAEAIAETSLGASCFSDWWGYKFEVFDAIPGNGTIMYEQDVVVSFNSDSNELARRLNAEAAKAVKYGGVPPEDALKFVTLNPAIQLDVADRIGSLEVGKDADLAVWSGPPMSTMSRCLATYVDGIERFSESRDAELQAEADAERERLIQRVLAGRRGDGEGGRGGRGRRGGGAFAFGTHDHQHDHQHAHVHTDEELAAIEREVLFMLRNGIDPTGYRPGDCGCTIHSLVERDQ